MRVLVIEDDEAQADGVRRSLEADGYVVDLSRDGLDGLWQAEHGSYQAIVLDLLLPNMNGFVVCRTLREKNIDTPVLMLTAKNGVHDEAEGLDTGADDYLTKPFSYVVLLARLRALIRRSTRGGNNGDITVGELTLDARHRRCTRNGRTVVLTDRETAVLEALACRAGEIIAKAELIQSVWGFDHDGDPNIVEVYVRRLRNKLDDDADGWSAIRTVRGVGYQLVGVPPDTDAEA